MAHSKRGCFVGFMDVFTQYIFEYETPKIIAISSIKIGLAYRLIQLIIITYIIGYVIIYTRGYQDIEVGQSTIITKVKGIASSMNRPDLPSEYARVWDNADYVIPPMSKESLFIMTNAILTSNQTMSTCPEHVRCDPHNPGKTCKAGQMFFKSNGVTTGRCVKAFMDNYTCEISAWCPLEDDTVANTFTEPLLSEFGNFTIYVKNVVEFPYFKIKRNIDNLVDSSYHRRCTYDPETAPLCPIFRVADVVHLAKADLNSIAKYGGILNVLIKWDCNLDYSLKHCNPVFTFRRMDETESQFSTSYNFRYAHFYKINGQLFRDLVKAYGILFIFNIDSRARKFSIVQLSMNVGAGLALLGIATVLMDMVLTNFSRDRKFYKQQKFTTLASPRILRKKSVRENGAARSKSMESFIPEAKSTS